MVRHLAVATLGFNVMRAKLVCVALALVASGCAVGPDYHRPPVPMPAHYKESDGWVAAAPADAAPKGDWWTGFDDPMLDALAPQVAVSNQSVRQSYANYQAALAEVRVARSALFPTIGLSASAARQRAAIQSRSTVFSSGALEGTASWAPDLWGKVHRSIEENQANAQASAATLANTTLSGQITLATAVVELHTMDVNSDLLRKTVEAYRHSLSVVENQVQGGTAPPSDLIRARAQLEQAQSSLIALGIARAQYAHAIAVLVGKNPEDLEIPHSSALPSLPTVPVGIPSTLLQRRPDIAVAEREMAAQNAAIGVAVAAYFPSLSLSAADGLAQSPLSGLLHIANHVWSLGADVGVILFDAGQREGEVAGARARYDAAVANYRGVVLSALQNVENDLSGLRILARQAEVLAAAVRDATHGAELAMNEYRAGTVDFTTVATAQATELAARQSALNVQQQRLLGTVALIGDLGGGWSVEAPATLRQTEAER